MQNEQSEPNEPNELALEALNLRGLRQLRWSPSGVGALVGPNGSGKSTVLQVMQLLSQALDRGLPAAVGTALGGGEDLVHRDAGEGPCLVALGVGRSRWELDLRAAGAVVEHRAADQILHGGAFVGLKRLLEPVGIAPGADDRTLLRRLLDQGDEHPAVAALGQAVRRMVVIAEPALRVLGRLGSDATEGRMLRNDGSNALAVLRAWNERRSDEHRLQFVKEWLLAAFPDDLSDLSLEAWGGRVQLRVSRPGSDRPLPGALAGQGVLSMLVSLTALAQAQPGALVAIDEPERGLHGLALRQLVEAAHARAEQDGVHVVFATHSPILLEALSETPERIWIMDREQETVPTPLSELDDPRWLLP